MKKTLSLFLALLVLTGVGCVNKTVPVTEKTETTVTTSTVTEVSPAVSATLPSPTSSSDTFVTSSIDLNNSAIWPRFSFKELGLSIRLPFENDSIQSELRVCKNKIMTQFIDNKQSIAENELCNSSPYNYQGFSEVVNSTINGGNPYSFLEANSEFGFIPEGIDGPFTVSFPYDFYKKGDKYYFVPVPNIIIFDSFSTKDHYLFTPFANHSKTLEFEIHPLSVSSHQKHTVIIFDAYCDYYNGRMEEKTACTTDNAEFQILIKLNNNKYFKIASLHFDLVRTKTTLEQIKTMVNSIEFTAI